MTTLPPNRRVRYRPWRFDRFDTHSGRWVVWLPLLLLLVWPLMPRWQVQTASLSEDLIGRSAPSTLVASHAFEVQTRTDAEIRAAGEAAARDVAPVWDHQVRLSGLITGRVRQAFLAGREALIQEARARRAALPERPTDEEADPDNAGNADARYRDDISDDDLAELLSLDDRIQIVTPALHSMTAPGQEQLSESLVRMLAEAGLSTELEEAIVQLVERIQQNYIVENRDSVERIGSEGILLRVETGAQEQYRPVNNLPGVILRSDLTSCNPTVRYEVTQDLSSRQRNDVQRIACHLALVNLVPNEAQTLQLMAEARQVAEDNARAEGLRRYEMGDILVDRGRQVTERDVRLVEQLVSTMPAAQVRWQQWIGALSLTLLALAAVLFFSRRWHGAQQVDFRDRTMILFVLVAQVWATVLVSSAGTVLIETDTSTLPLRSLLSAVPLAAGAMLIRIVTNHERALMYTLVYACLVFLIPGADGTYVIEALVAGLTGAALLDRELPRRNLYTAAAGGGGLAFLVSASSSLLSEKLTHVSTLLHLSACSILSITVTVALVMVGQGVLEYLFRYTTPTRLQELFAHNHPLRHQLRLEAPGTEDHSVQVSELVVAAAAAVGADGLLGQVGALFHDVGKLANPQYFAENQSDGVNLHDRLSPADSVAILRAHISDGVDLARKHGLPEEVIDFIREHHGTRQIQVFLHRARQQASDVVESDFRYHGPKPQSVETAICLLADGIEAHTRAVADRSVENLRRIVDQHMREAFEDGQFSDCQLTLQHLHTIADAMHKRLQARYHHRPSYPSGGSAKLATAAATPPAIPEPAHARPDDSRTSDAGVSVAS
ncbi:MAG: HDIG domain-containing protein [Myxococcales bacterium]|nr:HDIG domain-containing protein [Myxococcales bacterium]